MGTYAEKIKKKHGKYSFAHVQETMYFVENWKYVHRI
jgi:hypothetical protein